MIGRERLLQGQVRAMLEAQGFHIAPDGSLYLSEGVTPLMAVPEEMIPHCPECGRPMSMNLRADDTFVQDEGWYLAAKRYETFLEKRMDKKVVYLELGVGYNTPGIIKYPFWRMTAENPRATYVCINQGEAAMPKEIAERSVCIDGDLGEVLQKIGS